MSDRSALIAQLQTDLHSIIARLEELKSEPAVILPDASAGPSVEAPPQPAPTHPGFGDEGAFYDFLRDNDLLGPTISATEFRGCDAITRACAAAQWPLSWTADALATAYLETAQQMIPVREAYWLSESAANAYFRRMYDIEGQRPAKARELGNLSPGDGAKYCGRGYPQLTGKTNYAKMAKVTGLDLVGHPELALRPDAAATIMIRGMEDGMFTSKKLADYLPRSGPATKAQFTPARRIINGLDRASDVASYAVSFQQALQAGKWAF